MENSSTDPPIDPYSILRRANTTSNRIIVTTSREYQENAARNLSAHLDQMGCPHAFIGGFAWSLLGSSRPTEPRGMKIEELRDQISKIDHHFAESLFKFYFLREIPQDIINAKLNGEDRIRQGRDRVLIETLSTGTIGLPTTATPIFHSSLSPVPILHPSVLILTKLQRWCRFYTSSRPKTRAKSLSDKADIDFILEWLRENNILIAFDQYSGRSRDDLLRLVRIFWDQKLYDGDEEFSDTIQAVLSGDDLRDILKARKKEGNLVEKAKNATALAEAAKLEVIEEVSKMGREDSTFSVEKDVIKSRGDQGHPVDEASNHDGGPHVEEVHKPRNMEEVTVGGDVENIGNIQDETGLASTVN